MNGRREAAPRFLSDNQKPAPYSDKGKPGEIRRRKATDPRFPFRDTGRRVTEENGEYGQAHLCAQAHAPLKEYGLYCFTGDLL
jgi:hypothetical protein